MKQRKQRLILTMIILFTGLYGCTFNMTAADNKEESMSSKENIERDQTMSADKDTMENVDPVSAIAEPVDLGLSVKWASFNIGASSPEEYGGLYGWGDAAGKLTSEDDTEYPSMDPPKNISGTDFDIAHEQWGGNWRLPTREEQEELLTKCTWRMEKYAGIDGATVIGPNGNSIFLPAVGGRIKNKTYYQVSGADYWSGTRGSGSEAYYMFWWRDGNEEPQMGQLPRHYGFAVRAVHE